MDPETTDEEIIPEDAQGNTTDGVKNISENFLKNISEECLDPRFRKKSESIRN